MSVHWPARSRSLAWSNPVTRWWGFLTVVSGANIAAWVVLYRGLEHPAGEFGGALFFLGGHSLVQPAGSAGATPELQLMLLLCAAYVFGCAFRSLLPRADVQRICLFDTWLSSVTLGRSVATVAELAFAVQWAMVLHLLGAMTGADTVVTIAWVIVPLIVVAEGFSWYAVLTRNFLGNAVENSIWAGVFFLVGIALARLLPEFDGLLRAVFATAIVGVAGYLAFLLAVDVPMYLKRWRTEVATGRRLLGPLEGLRDASTRWVVTRDIAAWKDEIPWMSLYFSAAVWSSLALCVFYAFAGQLPR